MSFDQLARDFGPLIAALLVGGAGIFGTLKLIVPQLVKGFIETRQKQTEDELADKKQRREQVAEEEATERQTQITLLSQVIQLSMASQNQNKELIQFITGTLRIDLQGYQGKIETALKDIDQRWLAVNRELQAGSGKTQILTSAVSELNERVLLVEQTLRAALNGNLKK